MSKQCESLYYEMIGSDGNRHSLGKPWSDEHCPEMLADFSAIIQLLPKRFCRILDLGCGHGWTSRFLARLGHSVVAVDIAEKAIEMARANCENQGVSVEFHCTDYEELCYNNEFDAVLFFDSLHHALDEKLALRKAFEALKSKGVCITHEPGQGHCKVTATRRVVEKYGVTEKDMHPEYQLSLAQSVGFRAVHVYPLPSENRLIDYRIGEESVIVKDGFETRVGASSPLKGASLVKRLFHWLVRTRLGLNRTAYKVMLNRLPRLAALLGYQHWESISKHGAIVAMVK